ncbi:hypothetical protein SCUCBS95973_008582 [Sporothrix curviconia]|uniref:Rhodopsin domain-containing protein n=1 Tax=Sporothrix curviconia TaxID=1260050 RepID=A0ABP0CP99_9PEZI
MPATADLTRGPVLLGIAITSELLALTTCLVRFLLRKRRSSSTSRGSNRRLKHRHLGLDDYAIAVAAVVSFVATIFAIIEGSSMVDSAHALEFDWLGQPWFMMGTTFAKISVCLFFLRLVGSATRRRILLSSQILLMAVLNFAFSLTTNLQCRPLDKLWDLSVVGVCWDPSVQLNIGYFQGAFSVFWWLFLSLFPVMIVRDLEMHQTMRWPFYFLSSLSLVAAIFATVRAYETSQTVPGVYTFDSFFATVLSILEQNVGIIAANVLPMGSLFWKRQQADATERRRQQQQQQQEQEQQNPFESGAVSVHSGDGDGDDDEYGYDLGEPGRGRGRRRSDSQSSYHSSIKQSPMLIIQGPRENGYNDDENYDENDGNSGPNRRRGGKLDGRTLAPRAIKPTWSTKPTKPTKAKQRLVDMPLRTILSRSALLLSRSGRDQNGGGDSMTTTESGDGLSAWPRGIIKTVEVEVVEEDIASVLPAAHLSSASHHRLPSNASGVVITSDGNQSNHNHSRSISRHSRMDSDNDWVALLRAGPTPPGSRGPSRQGSRGPSRQGYN